jgi:DNA-directed RNA polymerase specialized sigma24 family protein
MIKAVNEIDLALSVLCVTANRDETLTTYEIADVCECSQTLISKTLRNALKKLRGSKGQKLRDFI